MGPLERWAKRHKGVDLDAYIDDFQIVVVGKRLSVMQRAADAGSAQGRVVAIASFISDLRLQKGAQFRGGAIRGSVV